MRPRRAPELTRVNPRPENSGMVVGMDEQTDFIAKLRQIEEVALISAGNATGATEKSSFRHIALIARTLRSRLEIGTAQVLATGPKLPHDPDDKPPA